MHLSRSRRLLAGLAAVAVLAASAVAILSPEEPPAVASAETDLAVEAAPVPAAMRAFLDPETGELSYESAPLQLSKDAELARALSRSTEGLVEVYHPEGHVTVNVEGRFQSVTMARINAGGQVETACVHDADAAESFRCDHDHTPVAEVQ